VFGIVANPAAARTGRAEVLMDVGLLGSMTHFTLESHPDDPLVNAGMTPVPFLAAVVPITDHWGVGATVGVPYARGGKAGGPDAANGYFGYDTNLLMVEETVSLAVDGWGPVDLGGSFRAVQGSFGSTKQYDLGSTLIGLLGPDAGLPLQDPFLTGTLQVGTLRDVAFGGGAGLRVESERGHGLQLAWRSPVKMVLTGPFNLQLLNHVNVAVEGETDAEFNLPQEVWISGEVPAGRLTLGGELGWIDYSTRDGTYSTTRDLTVTATDATLDALLGAYGVTSDEFLQAESKQYSRTGQVPIFTGGAHVELPFEEWTLRSGLSYAPYTTPDEFAAPNNLDFTSWNPRLGALYDGGGRVVLGMSADAWLNETRVITTDQHSEYNDPQTGLKQPNGNGTYALTLYRFGVTLVVR